MTMSIKPTIAVAIDQNLLEWIDSQIKEKRYANRSHAIQSCVYNEMKRSKEGD